MLPAPNEEDFMASNQRKQDENLFVKFDIRTRPDKVKTKEDGVPRFKEVEYIDIRIPGKKDSVCHPVTDNDKKRFPRHYEAFKNRTGDLELEGTPLREWTGVTRSMAEEMIHQNIMTVEMLAITADTQISNFMGGFGVREKAREYVEQMKSDKPFREMKLENEELRAVARDQQETIDNLAEQVKVLTENMNSKTAKKSK